MAEQVQKGWLTTRDGDKYAPATLIENVYTRSGVAYDTQVRKYLASIQSSSQTSLIDINAKLEDLYASVSSHDKELDQLSSDIIEEKELRDKTIYMIITESKNIIWL